MTREGTHKINVLNVHLGDGVDLEHNLCQWILLHPFGQHSDDSGMLIYIWHILISFFCMCRFIHLLGRVDCFMDVCCISVTIICFIISSLRSTFLFSTKLCTTYCEVFVLVLTLHIYATPGRLAFSTRVTV